MMALPSALRASPIGQASVASSLTPPPPRRGAHCPRSRGWAGRSRPFAARRRGLGRSRVAEPTWSRRGGRHPAPSPSLSPSAGLGALPGASPAPGAPLTRTWGSIVEGKAPASFSPPSVCPIALALPSRGSPLAVGHGGAPEVWFSSPGERGFTGHRAFPGPGRGALPSHPQRCLDISPIQGKAAGLTLKPLRRRRLLPAVPIPWVS